MFVCFGMALSIECALCFKAVGSLLVVAPILCGGGGFCVCSLFVM